jgi:hypothetical protein
MKIKIRKRNSERKKNKKAQKNGERKGKKKECGGKSERTKE